MIIHDLYESPQLCPECGGISFSDLILAEKKDACYYKVKASAKVWPSAYASGRLVQCRKKGADSYGNKSEGVAEGSDESVSLRDMVNVVDKHYPKYYAELSGSDISDKQFERAIINAYKAIVKKQGVAEGKVEPQVDHRGDVDLDADIEVLGVDYNTETWKITYNGKPYTVKADYFSREDLSRWQIPDYDVEIINRNGKNIMKMIDWDNEGSSKTDRQIRMVNTIIAYLDTENAQDIQYMAWKDQELDNVTAYEFYNDIRDFYHKDQQKIDQTVQWLFKNMTNDEAREGLADYIKNPVNPMDWNTKENLKKNRPYNMYVAFSYSREGNTEMTPGMNLPKIQLNDPDDEDELQYQLDALFKKVEFKFDAFENKIIELGQKFSLSNPDLGSGMGNREMFWDLTMQTAWPKEYKYTQNAATDILNFKAAVDKYAKSFNSSLIKIGLPGISEYAIWYGVLSDDLTEQQVNYFATPEGFANVANGKIDVSKMINDNMQRKSLEEKLGDNRPKLGSKRDAGKSIRKWRKSRGLDETGVAEDLTRRGFLRGLGAAALAGAAGSALAGSDDSEFPNKVQKLHSDMMEKNPRYAKEHEALGIALARGFVGAAAENNKRWYQKTAELLQKYGVKVNEGVAEDQLDEKSTSQAQFRTMAAAAHNPEFARKVGISQDVAREFNKADKGQDYKKLPARTTEESERGRGRPTTGEWDPTSGKVGRIEKTPTGIRHHADPSRYGGTEPDPEFDTLNKNTINAMDRALGVKWDRESKKYFSPLKVDMDEGEQQKGADYRDPSEADYGDDYQDMVARMKKLAGLGPLKTVYDPNKRVYRNMPTAVQPKK